MASYLQDGKQYSQLQLAFLDSLLNEGYGDIRQAMTSAGYSKGTAQRDVTGPLKDEIVEVAKLMLANNAPRAAGSFAEIMASPAKLGAKNQLAAAQQILDRIGVVKPQHIEVEATGGGVVLLPPKEGS